MSNQKNDSEEVIHPNDHFHSASESSDDLQVCLESSNLSSDNKLISVAWTVDSLQNIVVPPLNQLLRWKHNPSLMKFNLGLQIIRATLEQIERQWWKKSTKKARSSSLRKLTPSPIQLKLWPALLTPSNKVSSDLSSCNFIGIAPTGSGKTMAYAIPIISHAVQRLLCQECTSQRVQVHAIVLLPTRELAIQVSQEFNRVSKVANKMLEGIASEVFKNETLGHAEQVESIAIYGGVDLQTQIAMLGLSNDGEKKNDTTRRFLVLAATPGRMLDILRRTSDLESIFKNIRTIVFDEADRMAVNVEMVGQIEEILRTLKQGRKDDITSCLISATLAHKAKQVYDNWVPYPRVVIKIDAVTLKDKHQHGHHANSKLYSVETQTSIKEFSNDESIKNKTKLSGNLDLASIPSHLVQTLHVCASHKKPKKLILTLQRIYSRTNDSKSDRSLVNSRLCIVFFAQIKTIKFISKLLEKDKFKCVELFGSLRQIEREERLMGFRAGKSPILLATDIAARGIHVSNVNYIVNYDFPGSLDQYVHRCGRAGRNQHKIHDLQHPPTVYSFFTREFAPMANSVIELLKMCKAYIDPNLLALGSSSIASTNTKNKRKRECAAIAASKNKNVRSDDESDVDEFSCLNQHRVILKRASHVSDVEDSDDENSVQLST